MSLPSLARWTAIKSAFEAIESIKQGDNYRHTAETVTYAFTPTELLSPSLCPWFWIAGGDGSNDLQMSMIADEDIDILVRCVMFQDNVKYPDKSSVELIEELIADIEAALDVDPTRGNTCMVRTRRTLKVLHSNRGTFSLVDITDSYKFNREV